MSMNINGEYVVAFRVDHDRKEFAVTCRHAELAGCEVIDGGVTKLLHWNWFRLNKPNQPELHNWPIIADKVTREIGRKTKADIIRMYEALGYTLHNIKGWH